tara:strand:- start:49168 stop:50358 length:1191 start_codon:yes stop_codon:yes gene_type:complete
MVNVKKIEYLIGENKINKVSIIPFDNKICDFLNTLSNELNSFKEIKKYPDLKTLAFWLRKKNIENYKIKFSNFHYRFGVGLVFHITPSNIPINFAYSLIFGLLSGNTNIIKVPSQKFDQVNIICKIIKKILKNKKFNFLKKMITIVRYSDEDQFTNYISSQCDARVIWGGDKTINKIRKFPIPTRSTEVTFADRYSISIINSSEILNIDKKKMIQLVEQFYNDTFIVDQNGCSSPQLILWYGSKKNEAKDRFWRALYNYTKKKYDMPDIASIDKFNLLFENILSDKNIVSEKRFGNIIYTISINKLDKRIDRYRGKWGFFYQYDLENLKEIKKAISKKIQTITYFGFKKEKFIEFINNNNIDGIDRIVPFGQALDLGLVWDGYNIINTLSRIVEVK